MRQLLYVSNTSRHIPGRLLDDILAASRKNNAALGVTGMLLYLDGGFLQVLEGEDAAVSEIYAKIRRDERHWNVKALLDREAPRSFGTWSMGFASPSASVPGDATFAITRDAIDGKLKPGAPADIVALLRTFYQVSSYTQPR